MSNLYPIFLKLENLHCLVVGGGNVATRKALSLLENGAKVCVVSLKFEKKLLTISKSNNNLTLKKRKFRNSDLSGVAIAIAATDNNEINRKVFESANKKGIWVNVVDVPDLCNFYLASTIKRGNLTIAISTGGKCPALAKKIRLQLEKQFDEHYGILLESLSDLRKDIARKYPNDPQNRIKMMNKEMKKWI